jgi:hypothetical protein
MTGSASGQIPDSETRNRSPRLGTSTPWRTGSVYEIHGLLPVKRITAQYEILRHRDLSLPPELAVRTRADSVGIPPVRAR